jgi:TfoX/Sxy family transcriptional regulator of competence genes
MASSLDFVEYVCEQIRRAGNIAFKKMFGEYCIYCNGKPIGLICDNQFYVKKTKAGLELLPNAEEAPPYTGAKPYFVIENLEDVEFLGEFVRKTYEELPIHKPKN